MNTLRNALSLIFLLALCACGSEDGQEPRCIDEIPTDCAPLYEPTFENIYAITLEKKCALGGASCHGNDGNKGGLNLQGGADLAYEQLLNPDLGLPRIHPDDIFCSEFIYRLESSEPDTMMPPGSPLGEEERCAIRQWLAQGAPP